MSKFLRVSILALFCASGELCLAEDGVVGAAPSNSLADSQVIVSVRTVRASDPLTGPATRKLKIDERIRDLSQKLSKLPYGAYSLLSAERLTIGMKHRQSLTLAGGQTLTVRPLYADDERVGMWLKWQEPNGAEILDTRMHFDYGESMIAGTDNTPESGVILAIDVSKP